MVLFAVQDDPADYYLIGSMKSMPYVIYFIKLYFSLTILGACSE